MEGLNKCSTCWCPISIFGQFCYWGNAYYSHSNSFLMENKDHTQYHGYWYPGKKLILWQYNKLGHQHNIDQVLVYFSCSTMGINSPYTSAAYMRWWTGSALVQIMACCQAIIWTSAGLLSIGHMETNFSEILIKRKKHLSFMKIHLNLSSVKWLPFWGEELTCENQLSCQVPL